MAKYFNVLTGEQINLSELQNMYLELTELLGTTDVVPAVKQLLDNETTHKSHRVLLSKLTLYVRLKTILFDWKIDSNELTDAYWELKEEFTKYIIKNKLYEPIETLVNRGDTEVYMITLILDTGESVELLSSEVLHNNFFTNDQTYNVSYTHGHNWLLKRTKDKVPSIIVGYIELKTPNTREANIEDILGWYEGCENE